MRPPGPIVHIKVFTDASPLTVESYLERLQHHLGPESRYFRIIRSPKASEEVNGELLDTDWRIEPCELVKGLSEPYELRRWRFGSGVGPQRISSVLRAQNESWKIAIRMANVPWAECERMQFDQPDDVAVLQDFKRWQSHGLADWMDLTIDRGAQFRRFGGHFGFYVAHLQDSFRTMADGFFRYTNTASRLEVCAALEWFRRILTEGQTLEAFEFPRREAEQRVLFNKISQRIISQAGLAQCREYWAKMGLSSRDTTILTEGPS